ncbi:hypothetical protein SAPIO_CDS7536 [Scedosporium apiospermum]|uniref:RTA1 domain-containing protein n=1 Tax=Pseudallescheria apiosperma TaxID=563466 RepID=A0A084G246_PSEDA|nr:uncharacterized protein SAPIO_CDS7536 [Scedosporium apiospermum]KEZ41408.1 hypothetical protein SAPIO_CDS7536 [Scedosporium apiospermum]
MATPSPTIADAATGTATSTSSPSCITAVPGKYGAVPIDACNSNYLVVPNFGANLAFAVLKYCWVLIMGSAWETAAFALRTAGTRDQQQLAYVVMGTLLLLLAPLWINAFLYMTVARLVHYMLPSQKVLGLRAVLLTKVFVGLDILSFLVQGTGGSLLSNQDEDSQDIQRAGQKIYMVGVGIQALFIIAFSVLTVAFYKRLDIEGRQDRNIPLTKKLVWVLLADFVFIMIRIIFRLVEFIPGANDDNPILKSENYVFCLDGLPVLLGLILLNVLHPGLVLRGPDSEFPRLSRKEKKALKREKKEAKKQLKAEKKQRKMERKEGGHGWQQVDLDDTSAREGDDSNVELVERNYPSYDHSWREREANSRV